MRFSLSWEMNPLIETLTFSQPPTFLLFPFPGRGRGEEDSEGKIVEWGDIEREKEKREREEDDIERAIEGK